MERRAGPGKSFELILADDLIAGEPLRDLDRGGLGRIRPMAGILAERDREFLADRAGLGLGRIGRAQNVAVFLDRVLAFEHLHDDRAGDHGLDQFAKEGPRLVNSIEGLRLLAGEPDPLLRDDAQARLFDQGVDRPGQVAPRRVGLEDGESAFDGHERPCVGGDRRNCRRL